LDFQHFKSSPAILIKFAGLFLKTGILDLLGIFIESKLAVAELNPQKLWLS